MLKTKPALVVSLAVLGVVAAVWAGIQFTGAAAPLALADPGPLVRWLSPVLKGLTDIAMTGTVGTLALAAWGLEDKSPQLRKALNISAGFGFFWVAIGLVSIVFRYSGIADLPIDGSARFSAGVWQFLTEIPLGQALGQSLIFAALAATCSLLVSSLRSVIFVAALSMAGIVPIALTGHAAGLANHGLAVNAEGLHLLAISVWLGGLIALMLLRSHKLVARYSTLAFFAFVVTAISGIAAAWVRIIKPENLLTPYGGLVLAKVAVLLILGCFGFVYRRGLIAGIEKRGSSAFARLALVEVGFMGLAAGLGAALSVSAPPQTQSGYEQLTPAQILTGDKLPPELTPMRWLTEWNIDILWTTVCLILAGLYIYGVYTLRKRGDAWPVYRTVSWLLGLGLLFYITSGAMNVYEHYLFSVHMIAHMLLTMAVPILLVPGAPVTLISRAAHKRSDDSRGLREWVLWAVHTPWARFFGSPLVSAVMFASSLVVFYFTPIFGWATRDHLGHEWMIVHFLITGYLFVQSLIGADPGPKLASYPIRLMVLILTLTFHAFFGLALMQGTTLLLPEWFGAMGRTWGADPLTDQQTGGAIAWGIGELPSAVLTIIVSRQWFMADKREQKRLDRASDRSGNKDIEEYNAMLAKLAGRKEER